MGPVPDGRYGAQILLAERYGYKGKGRRAEGVEFAAEILRAGP